MNIAENLSDISKTINDLTPKPVRLVAVSKKKPATLIEQAYFAGQKDFGENYVQEALAKIAALKHHADIVWHFIGAIQSNKTAVVSQHFHWVHSLDRAKIAERLNAHRPATLAPLNVLIQVNIDNEKNKAGVLLADVDALVVAVSGLKHLSLRGFMCIPNIKNATQSFKKMYQLKKHYDLPELSMGMSGDLAIAIKNGSTMVRIGQAIFGAR